VLKPGSAAAVLVWEKTWAVPFGAAVRRSGGQLVTSSRIPTQAILAAIEADRAAQAQGGLRCRCSGIAGTGRARSAEAATGARTAARTGATAATAARTGATGAMTAKTVVAAGRGCSDDRELEDQAGHAIVSRRVRLSGTSGRRAGPSGLAAGRSSIAEGDPPLPPGGRKGRMVHRHAGFLQRPGASVNLPSARRLAHVDSAGIGNWDAADPASARAWPVFPRCGTSGRRFGRWRRAGPYPVAIEHVLTAVDELLHIRHGVRVHRLRSHQVVLPGALQRCRAPAEMPGRGVHAARDKAGWLTGRMTRSAAPARLPAACAYPGTGAGTPHATARSW
jgi:hypothetical protein